MLDVKMLGEDRQVFLQISGVEGTTRRAIRKSFYFIGRILVKEAKRAIRKDPKTGIVYRNVHFKKTTGRGEARVTTKRKKKRHKSSAAGESHANLSGDTMKSLGFFVQGTQFLKFGYGVNSRDQQAKEYMEFLEFGTPNGKMKPRPTLKNTVFKLQSTGQNHVEEMIGKGMKEMGAVVK